VNTLANSVDAISFSLQTYSHFLHELWKFNLVRRPIPYSLNLGGAFLDS
jgi:hypothetical protein